MFQLFQVQTGRGFADAVQIKPLKRLCIGENLMIAVGPAKARKVVAQGGGGVAHGGIILNSKCAVAFAELFAVRSVDQRDMRPDGHAPPHRGIDLFLP